MPNTRLFQRDHGEINDLKIEHLRATHEMRESLSIQTLSMKAMENEMSWMKTQMRDRQVHPCDLYRERYTLDPYAPFPQQYAPWHSHWGWDAPKHVSWGWPIHRQDPWGWNAPRHGMDRTSSFGQTYRRPNEPWHARNLAQPRERPEDHPPHSANLETTRVIRTAVTTATPEVGAMQDTRAPAETIHDTVPLPNLCTPEAEAVPPTGLCAPDAGKAENSESDLQLAHRTDTPSEHSTGEENQPIAIQVDSDTEANLHNLRCPFTPLPPIRS